MSVKKKWTVRLFKTIGNSDWLDLGIGFLEFESNSIVIYKEENPQQVLKTFQVQDEVYHKQGDTILTWISQEKVSFALNFLDKSKVQEVLQEICKIQKKHNDELEEDSENEYSILHPNSDNLYSVLDELTYGLKERLEVDILESGFLEKIAKIFDRLDMDKAKLHALFLVYKQLCNIYLVHLSSEKIIDSLLESNFESTLKALKFDPSLDGKEFDLLELFSNSKFLNILDIQESSFLTLISKINKLMFIKDTALARCLDDHACVFLVVKLQTALRDLLDLYTKSLQIRNTLYEKLEQKDPKALDFLIDLVGISKTCTAQERHDLFESFFRDGIVSIVEKNSYDSENPKLLEFVGDFFSCLIDVSPLIIKNLLFNGSEDLASKFLSHISKKMMLSLNLSVIQDISKFLRTLIDPDYGVFEQVKLIFYNDLVPGFIQYLQTHHDVDTSIELLDLFSGCIDKHQDFEFLSSLIENLLPLLPSLMKVNKHTCVHALKLLRSLVTRKQQSCFSFFLRFKAIDLVLTCLEENSQKENLAFSVALSVCMKVKDSELASVLNLNIFNTLKKIGLHELASGFKRNSNSGIFQVSRESEDGKNENKDLEAEPVLVKKRKLFEETDT